MITWTMGTSCAFNSLSSLKLLFQELFRIKIVDNLIVLIINVNTSPSVPFLPKILLLISKGINKNR